VIFFVPARGIGTRVFSPPPFSFLGSFRASFVSSHGESGLSGFFFFGGEFHSAFGLHTRYFFLRISVLEPCIFGFSLFPDLTRSFSPFLCFPFPTRRFALHMEIEWFQVFVVSGHLHRVACATGFGGPS